MTHHSITASDLLQTYSVSLPSLLNYDGCFIQVPPAELESLLQIHPDIDEVAVVP